jgi:hypothetical protein
MFESLFLPSVIFLILLFGIFLLTVSFLLNLLLNLNEELENDLPIEERSRIFPLLILCC